MQSLILIHSSFSSCRAGHVNFQLLIHVSCVEWTVNPRCNTHIHPAEPVCQLWGGGFACVGQGLDLSILNGFQEQDIQDEPMILGFKDTDLTSSS